MAFASPNLSSGVSTAASRFFAFLKSFTGKRRARIKLGLVCTFCVWTLILGSSEAEWRCHRRWIVFAAVECAASLVGSGSLRRDASNPANVRTEFLWGNILAKGGAGCLRDVLFHERSAEVVRASLQASEGSFDSQFHPGNLDAANRAVQEHAGERVSSQMFVVRSSRSRAPVFVKARVLVNESERYEFGETASALLNRAQQQKVAHPIRALFDMAVHHGRSGGNSQLVCCGDDFNPASDGQFVGAELLADTVIENLSSRAGYAAET